MSRCRVVFNRAPQIAARIRAKAVAALDQAVDEAFITAYSLVPVKTGALQASITKLTVSNLRRRIETQEKSTPYGPYIEYGTVNASAQPFMTPAYDRASAMLIASLKTILRNP